MTAKTLLNIYINNLLLGLLAWFALDNLGHKYNYFDVTIAVTVAMAMVLPPDVGPKKPTEPDVVDDWFVNRRTFIKLAFGCIACHLLLKLISGSIF